MKVSKSVAYSLHGLMYMVRHLTQLPVNLSTISKAERIPRTYLAKIFQKLAKGGIIRAAASSNKGYEFARAPEKIMLLEIFEIVEGKQMFTDCPLRHCDCGGTPQNCEIFAQWHKVASSFRKVLASTDLESVAWNHPEHYFSDEVVF